MAKALDALVISVAAVLLATPLQGAMFIPGQFSVSETGSATYSIPIQVPPGTAGKNPKLALTYNSQAGNGLLGVGWSVSGLSAVSRCPRTLVQDGVRGGVNYDANDRFCLDGQRLMLVSGTYGADGAEYRTEREGFAKIVSYTSAGSGPAWSGIGPARFKVWTKSGQVMDYGNDAAGNSRIEAQGRTTGANAVVRVWALNKVSDTKGNYFTVTYTDDNANGQFYPTQIDYTGNATSTPTLTPYNSVRFAYETRSDVIPLYQAGSKIGSTVRLKNIQTYSGPNLVSDYRLAYDNGGPASRSRVTSITQCEGAGACLLPTTITWSSPPNQFGAKAQWASTAFNPNQGWFATMSQPQVFLVDANGDGMLDILGITNDYVGVQLNTGSGFGGKVQWASSTFNPNAGWFSTSSQPQVFVSDVNGDGLPDIIGITDNNVSVQLNSGSAFGAKTQWASSTFNPSSGWFTTSIRPRVFVLDVDGDGLIDILGITDNYVGVQLQSRTGPAFSAPAQWATSTFNPSQGWFSTATNPQVFVGDVNGDGLPDVVGVSENYVGVQLNTGSGFLAPAQWASTTFNPSQGWFNTSVRPQVFLQDVNGDGLADLIGISNNYVGVQLSTGAGFLAPVQWASSTFNPSSGWFSLATNPQVFFGDVNGDWLVDIIGVTDNYVGVQLNNGSSFAAPAQWASVTFNPNQGWFSTAFQPQVKMGPIKGDGTFGVIGVTDNYVGVQLVTGPTGFMPSTRIASIATGTGNVITLTYKPIADPTVYVKDSGSDAATYPNLDLVVPYFAVSSVTQSDGNGGTVSSSYKYGGAKANYEGRGFLGVRWMEVTDASGIKSRTEFAQTFPYIGLPKKATKTTSSGALLNQVDNAFSFNDLVGSNPACPASGAADPLPGSTAGKRYFTYVCSSIAQSWELNSNGTQGVTLPSVTTANTFDSYGNATQVVVSSSDGFSKTTTNTYANDVANWILGRLTRATVQSTAP